jgi:general secretion pathway protein D
MNALPRIARFTGALACAALLLVGCAEPALRDARSAADSGDHESAFLVLRAALVQKPSDLAVRAALARESELALAQLASQAGAARAAGRNDRALDLVLRLEAIDSGDPRAAALRREIERDARIEHRLAQASSAFGAGRNEEASAIVREVLTEAPQLAAARALQQRIGSRSRPAPSAASAMAPVFQKNVTLEFREAPLRTVFEALGRSSGVNFVFDKEVRGDAKINVFLKDVTLDEAMRVILATQQLDRKLLNDASVFIYPNTPGKQREHQELITRSFYLANADVKQAQLLIKTMAKTRDVYIDERLNLVIVRDTPEVVAFVDRLIASIDLPEPEVMLEVEVLEISRDQTDELGLQLPEQISYGLPGIAGDVLLGQRREFRASIANPAVVARLHGTSGASNLLANPKLRARNHEKAKVQIGEKLPVFTTTSVANVGISTSVAYLDTGLKLEVEPSVQLDNEVIMKVSLEVSNLIRAITGPQGSIAYQVGTRNATTSLRLRDGETQILAGLINDEDRKSISGLPGLANLPVLGRLFGVHTDSRIKTEIVLLITPRVVRNLSLPDASTLTLSAGVDASPGAKTLRLKRDAKLAVPISAASASAGDAAPATAAPAGAAAVAMLEVSTSGEVGSGQTVSVTLRSHTDGTMRGVVEFDTDFLRAGDGSASNSVPFELGPGQQKAIVLRALPAVARHETDVVVDVRSATAADGSSLRASVEGSTTITVVPR